MNANKFALFVARLDSPVEFGGDDPLPGPQIGFSPSGRSPGYGGGLGVRVVSEVPALEGPAPVGAFGRGEHGDLQARVVGCER